MKSFSEFKAYLSEYEERYKVEGNDRVVAELKRIGRETIEWAAEHKQTGNITMNQMEGFGYAVFFNRELVKGSMGFLDKKIYRGDHIGRGGKLRKGAEADRRGKRGRIEALDAIRSYIPDSKGYVLFLTNAVWYSMIHEVKLNRSILQSSIPIAIKLINESFGPSVPVSVEYIRHPYIDRSVH